MRTAILVGLALLLTGCGAAGINAWPAPGFIFAQETGPLMVTDNEAPDDVKVGKAQAMSILGWIGLGDASISTAMADGGLTKVHHVDMDTFNVLGIYATYTVKVYGE